MAFDYKEEHKEFHLPAKRPQIVTIPPMNYLAVRGHGDPNTEGGEYKRSIELLDIQNPRYHHEIYLSDPRRCQTSQLKTVIRHPIKLSAVCSGKY